MADYVAYLERYTSAGFFDAVICNTQSLLPTQTTVYQEEKVAVGVVESLPGRILIAQPLLNDVAASQDGADPLARFRASVRHDPVKLADALRLVLR